MTLKIIAGVSFATLMLASAAQAHEGKYVTNSANEAVKNSAGECVKAAYGNMPAGCEGAQEEVYTYIVPAPPAAPAPMPRHAPVVVPKVKAKGNYKGAVRMDPASRAVLQGYRK